VKRWNTLLTGSELVHGKSAPMEVLIAGIRRRASSFKIQVKRVCPTLSSTASRTVSCCFKVSPMASPMPFSVPIPFSMLSKALSCLAFASSQSCSRVERLYKTRCAHHVSYHHSHSAQRPAAFMCMPVASHNTRPCQFPRFDGIPRAVYCLGLASSQSYSRPPILRRSCRTIQYVIVGQSSTPWRCHAACRSAQKCEPPEPCVSCSAISHLSAMAVLGDRPCRSLKDAGGHVCRCWFQQRRLAQRV